MRYLLHLLAFVAAESPPEFVVVNKMPPTFTVVNKVPAAPAVAAVRTFRGPKYHSGHQCWNCGQSQYRIAGWTSIGQHRHVCSNPNCRAEWIH